MLYFSEKGAPIDWYNFRGLRHKKGGGEGNFRGPGSKIREAAEHRPLLRPLGPSYLWSAGASCEG